MRSSSSPKRCTLSIAAGVVELQRLGLPPGLIEAGTVERPGPEGERVGGVPFFREVTESYMGDVRLLRPQVGRRMPV